MTPIPHGSLLSVEVVLEDPEERFIDRTGDPDLSRYPKDTFWIFSACLEDFGNHHDLCLEDTKLRRGFLGHCICRCHHVAP